MSKLKKFLFGFSITACGVGLAATFSLFSPATGILVGNASTYITSAAVWSNIQSLLTGTCTSVTVVHGDGSCSAVTVPTAANPTATVGTSAVNGSAATFMRSDAAPAINTTMSPTMTGNWTHSPSAGVPITLNGVAGNFSEVINSGNSSTQAVADLEINRNGSTANAFAEGPNIDLADANDGTQTILQHSGGQTELWQLNSSVWTKIFNVTTSDVFNFPVSVTLSGTSVTNPLAVSSSNSTDAYTSMTCSSAANAAACETRVFNNAGAYVSEFITSSNYSGAALTNAPSGPLAGFYETPGGYNLCIGTSASCGLVFGSANTGIYTPLATGGSKGAGSINAQALYVNGVAVASSNGASHFNSANCPSGGGSPSVGYGVSSCTLNSTGNYSVIFSPAFVNTPVCTTNIDATGGANGIAVIPSAGSANVLTYVSGIQTNAGFSVICTGA